MNCSLDQIGYIPRRILYEESKSGEIFYNIFEFWVLGLKVDYWHSLFPHRTYGHRGIHYIYLKKSEYAHFFQDTLVVGRERGMMYAVCVFAFLKSGF